MSDVRDERLKGCCSILVTWGQGGGMMERIIREEGRKLEGRKERRRGQEWLQGGEAQDVEMMAWIHTESPVFVSFQSWTLISCDMHSELFLKVFNMLSLVQQYTFENAFWSSLKLAFHHSANVSREEGNELKQRDSRKRGRVKLGRAEETTTSWDETAIFYKLRTIKSSFQANRTKSFGFFRISKRKWSSCE